MKLDLTDEIAKARGNVLAACDPVQVFTRSGLTPDKWQASVLRNRARRVLLLASRQSGKTQTTAAAAVWEALFAPSLTLLFSPSLRQSSELLRRVKSLYAPFETGFPIRRESVLMMELQNGSRILSLPADEATTRGYAAANLVVIDEAARVSEELYYSVRPMLATTRGRLVVLSTPNGKRGWFYDEFTKGTGWEKTKIPASLCPRISPAHLQEERETLGETYFKQEYECEFLEVESVRDLASAPFSADVLDRIFSTDVKPLFIDTN